MQKLLLLHGALGSQAQFEALKVELSKDFEIHTLDFSGHGTAEIPSQAFSISGFCQQVLGWMQMNQVEKISIFGYSMGGYVGLYLARHYPEKVANLFTFATKWDWNPESAMKESRMLDSKKMLEKVPKYATYLQSLHGQKWEVLLEKTAAMMLELGNNPALSETDLHAIQIPVLAGVGDKDSMVSLEETIKIYRALPLANLLVLPNTIHPIDRIDTKKLAHQIRNYFG